MAVSTDAPTTFVLALTRLEGVGHVTARRLAERFADYEDLRGHSREQVLLRIKGVPNAEKITGRLFDEDVMRTALDEAEATVDALAERGVRLLSSRSDPWPGGLADLPSAERPLLLWAYGPVASLEAPSAALVARPPLDEAPFERAQALAQYLTSNGAVPVLGVQSGFDVAVAKRAAAGNAPVVLVAACGLAKLPRRFRPIAGQVVRAGGILLSPFPMQHGPFEHDERQRATLQVALANTSVFAPPSPDAPEERALRWATEEGRRLFLLADDAPDGAQPLRGREDFRTVLDAARSAAAERGAEAE